MSRRRLAPDEVADVEQFFRSYPVWPKGQWAAKAGVRVVELFLSRAWWRARDARRAAEGMPL